jgi:hypothetical protein
MLATFLTIWEDNQLTIESNFDLTVAMSIAKEYFSSLVAMISKLFDKRISLIKTYPVLLLPSING